MARPPMERLYPRYGKRALDLTLASLGLVLLAPVMAATAVVVRLGLGSPVLFRQDRPGRREQRFTLLKFRTMRETRNASGRLLSDHVRLTRLGRWLRRSSLDELPEMWNVIRGDMSLVGPRPLLTKYSPYYTNEERRRFFVRPGITGLAQVRGRNDLSWDERLAYDVWYVDHVSLSLDLRILATTFFRVLGGKGVHVDSRSDRLDLDVERAARLAGASELSLDARP